jgi:hypothetical protein
VVYDVSDDIETINDFKDLKTITGLWKLAKVDKRRTVVYWNDRIDLPSDTIYEYWKMVE